MNEYSLAKVQFLILRQILKQSDIILHNAEKSQPSCSYTVQHCRK